MKRYLCILWLLLAVPAMAGPVRLLQTPKDPRSVTLAWDANAETDIAGYNVYKGTSAGGPYIKVGSAGAVTQPTFTVSSLANGTHYFVVTAYNTSQLESGYSNEVSKAVMVAPAPPKNLRPIIEQIIAILKDLLQDMP